MQFRNPGAIIEETLRYRWLKKHFKTSRKRDVLLDLGCGQRPYFDLYKNCYNKTIGAEHPDAPFPKSSIDIYCEATSIPLESESIDTILCTEVLHDMPEPTQMLDETFRVLKKGGDMILTTPFVVPVVDGEYDHYRYTYYGLKYLLKKSGYSVISIQPVGDLFSSTITLWIKPWLKLFNVLSKKTGIKSIYSVYNPLLFLITILPQLIYLFIHNLPGLRKIYSRFSYGCTGFISHVKRPG